MAHARSAPRKRLDLSSEEDEGGPWTEVGKRRRLVSPPAPAPHYRQYRLLHHQETSDFNAIRRLERSYSDLSIRIKGSSRLGLILMPQNEETAFLLARLAREESFGISLGEVEVENQGVVLRYPLGFSLDPILDDPRVAFARRCTYSAGHGRREPTRQVEVTFRGQLPNSLDLGSWGVFSVRRYTREPLRCYKCQAFGHVQKHCRTRELCGVCSGRHPTSECISALRAGERRAARCPNCGKGHHAWFKLCPERLRRLPLRCTGQKENPREFIDQKPLPAAPLEASQNALGKREASLPLTTTAATATTTQPTQKRRRRKRKRSTATQMDTAPATTDLTPPPPPPPVKTDFAVQASPETQDTANQTPPPPPPPMNKDFALQASPDTQDTGTQTSEEPFYLHDSGRKITLTMNYQAALLQNMVDMCAAGQKTLALGREYMEPNLEMMDRLRLGNFSVLAHLTTRPGPQQRRRR